MRTLVALLALVGALAAAPGAHAAGTPNLTLTPTSPTTAAVGDDIDVDLRASTPGGAVEAYNLSYRVVLPGATSYVSGSVTTSNGPAVGEPVPIADQPFAGQTTLLWRNVTDLAGGTSFSLRFKVRPNASTYNVNANLGITADVFANSDSRWTPPFTTAGQHDTSAAHPATSSDVTKTTSTGYRAVVVQQSATNQPGGRMLRGLHTQQSVVTLSVRAGTTGGVTGTNLYQYLPPGLEYLGCGSAVDNTTKAPTNSPSKLEYPGAPAISVGAIPGCVTPNTVTTGTFDPPGPQPSGTYTRIYWNIGNVSTGATLNFPFAVAIPLRSNTQTWSGSLPSTTGAQGANLDNNSGPEIADGATLTDTAQVDASFGIGSVTNALDTSRTAEDLTFRKTSSTSGLTQGATNLWTLTAQTSEYRSAANVVITDTVPDGLCPLSGSANLTQAPAAPSDSECDPGAAPSDPYTSATEQSSGAFALRWDSSTVPALTELAPNATRSISYTTATRSHYQEAFADAGPVLMGDKATNAASIAANARVACGPGPTTGACPVTPGSNELPHDGASTTALTDAASLTLAASGGSADQQVALSGTDCTTASYTQAIPSYTPGDRVCWLNRVTFPSGLDTTTTQIRDFLPNTLSLDRTFGTDGDQRTANDTVGAATYDYSAANPGPGGALGWTMPTSTTSASSIFEHRLASKLLLPTGGLDGMLVENLFKASAGTTQADRYALRDTANVQLRMPVLGITERITAVDGTTINPSPVAARTIRGGEVLTYRLRVTNTGGRGAEQLEAWDRLPTGLTCADIVSMSLAGACSGSTVTFGKLPSTGPTVPATSGSVDLTFDLKVPTTIEVGQSLSTVSGVRRYQVTTNLGDTYTYTPASNIDSTLNGSANVPAVGDTTTLTGAAPTVTETRTTSLTETGNADTQATVGETVTYTVSATVPAGLTIREMKLIDAIDNRHTYVAGTLQQTAGPAMSLALASGTVTLTPGTSWTAPTGADTTFTYTFDALVTDSAANTRGSSLTNQAQLKWTPPGTANGGTQSTLTATQQITQIVEPQLTLTKTVDVGATPIAGGDNVLYTLTLATNGGTAHETTLVENVPTDITPLNAAGNLIANGESTLSGGVWNQSARTITFPAPATIVFGSPQVFTYRARVNTPVTSGGRLTTTANTTTTSLPGTVAAERTSASSTNSGYTASAAVTLNVKTATITKTSDVSTRTPGEKVLYTVDVTLPANVNYYDVHVRDSLPDAIDFDGYEPVGAASCIAGCTAGNEPTIRPYNAITNGDGTITAAWDLGDLGYEALPRTIRLQYRTHVRTLHRPGTVPVVRAQTAVNTVKVMTDRTDKVTAAFDPAVLPAPGGGFDDTSAGATRTITVAEPNVSLDKTISVGGGSYLQGPSTIHDGQALGYRITITNTGNAPLYDIAVKDTPDAGLRNVTLASGITTTTNTDGFSAGDPAMTWLVPGPIAAGATATLSYTADLPVITSLTRNQRIDNNALVTSSWGVPQATRTADGFTYRSYASATDTTRANYDAPALTFSNTTGATGNPKSSQAEVGLAFPWRMTVTNTSTTETATALTIRDTLPPNWRYVPGSATFTAGGAVTPTIVSDPAGDQLTFATSLTLAPSATRVLTYSAKPLLAAATTPGTGPTKPHVNTAFAEVKNSAGNPGDADGQFKSTSDTAQAILAVPALGVDVTPDAGTGAPGNPISYNVKVTNSGTVGMSNVQLAATMPSQATYVAGATTAAPATGFSELSASGSAATWKIASIAAGGTVNLTVPLATLPSLASGSQLVLAIDGTSDQTTGTLSDSGTFTLTRSSDLVASIGAAPNPAIAGGNLTYTLNALNNGPSAAGNVVLSTTLPSTVNYVSSPSQCVWASGARTVTCTFTGDLAKAATATASIVTSVDQSAVGNANASVSASSGEADPNAGNNTASVTVPITTKADLKLTATASPTSVAQSANATLTFVMTNDGPSDAQAARIVATLPSGVTYQSDDGSCTLAGATLTCPAATLASGASRTLQVVVRGDTMGTRTTSATASSTTIDPAGANNTATAPVDVKPSADLELVLTAPATIAAGSTMTVGLELTNNGPDAASGVTSRATLPAGTSLVSADPGCVAAGQVVTCTITGGLANGASATRSLQVSVPTALGDQHLTTTGTGGANEIDAGGSAAAVATVVGPSADVSVAVSGATETIGGGTARVGVTVSNAGPSTARDLVVAVTVGATGRAAGRAAGDDLVISGIEPPAGGTCSSSGLTATCSIPSLAASGTATYTIVLGVPASLVGGRIASHATATSSTPDPNGANAVAEREVAVVAPPATPTPAPTPGPAAPVVDAPAPTNAPVTGGVSATPKGKPTPKPTETPEPVDPLQPPTKLKITVKSSAKKLRGGKVITYTIAVKNTGKNVATGVKVCAKLPQFMSFAGQGQGFLSGADLCFRTKRLEKGKQLVEVAKARISKRAKKKAVLVGRAMVESDNAKKVSASVKGTVVSDGRVKAETVKGFTG